MQILKWQKVIQILSRHLWKVNCVVLEMRAFLSWEVLLPITGVDQDRVSAGSAGRAQSSLQPQRCRARRSGRGSAAGGCGAEIPPERQRSCLCSLETSLVVWEMLSSYFSSPALCAPSLFTHKLAFAALADCSPRSNLTRLGSALALGA